MKCLLALLVLCGCESSPGGGSRRSSFNVIYADDVDAGVRCYDWTIGGSHISCVKIR